MSVRKDASRQERSDADAALEREVRAERKFTLAEAIGRLAGPGSMKGASPVDRKQQVISEIETWLRQHLADSQGALLTMLLRRIAEDDFAPWIGDRPPDDVIDLIGCIGEPDGVPARHIALAHLDDRVVERHDAPAAPTNDRLGYHERLAIQMVEALGDITRQLDVLLLIFAHRHLVGVIQ